MSILNFIVIRLRQINIMLFCLSQVWYLTMMAIRLQRVRVAVTSPRASSKTNGTAVAKREKIASQTTNSMERQVGLSRKLIFSPSFPEGHIINIMSISYLRRQDSNEYPWLSLKGTIYLIAYKTIIISIKN